MIKIISGEKINEVFNRKLNEVDVSAIVSEIIAKVKG